jgi:hypothetical protein
MSHTPGRWHIVPYGDGSSLVIHSDEQNRVCFMATASSDRPTSHASIRANARLIAAAPALYDALKAIVQAEEAAFEEWRANNLPDWVEGHPAFDRYNAARAALSLAEGKEAAQ